MAVSLCGYNSTITCALSSASTMTKALDFAATFSIGTNAERIRTGFPIEIHVKEPV